MTGFHAIAPSLPTLPQHSHELSIHPKLLVFSAFALLVSLLPRLPRKAAASNRHTDCSAKLFCNRKQCRSPSVLRNSICAARSDSYRPVLKHGREREYKVAKPIVETSYREEKIIEGVTETSWGRDSNPDQIRDRDCRARRTVHHLPTSGGDLVSGTTVHGAKTGDRDSVPDTALHGSATCRANPVSDPAIHIHAAGADHANTNG